MNASLEVVHIEWIDSEAINQWSSILEIDQEFHVIHTVGMLIHQDADRYLIAAAYEPENVEVNAAIWIPRACVRKVTPLCQLNLKTK